MGLVDLEDETYVSLTTFKRDGTPVSTPVWVARDGGQLLIHSAAGSWKVKRIRRDKHVVLAGCSYSGKVHGASYDGDARILADTTRVQELEAKKYGVTYRVIRGLTALNRWLRRKPDAEAVTIAITPATEPSVVEESQAGAVSNA